MTAAVSLLAWLSERARPMPFTTSGDAFPYFLPLIKAHTDTALRLSPQRVIWELGSGWSVAETAQVGLLYLPYHLSNVLARLAGRPLALLELSAWLHLWAAGLLMLALLPGALPPRERTAWAILAAGQPAPFILGMNWHPYLASYPWFLALGLLWLRNAGGDPWPLRERLGLALASALFFMSAHPQMYVIGMGLIALWGLSLGPLRAAWTGGRALAIAQLPLAVPILFLRMASLHANPNWMEPRRSPDFLLWDAQGLPTVLHGLLLGNLANDGGFRIWNNVPWTGEGMFFAPLLPLSMWLAWRRRKPGWIALATFCVLLMGIKSAPWLRHVAVGPLGFRWTWKLAGLLGPLGLLSAAWLGTGSRWPRARLAGLAATALLGGLVCLRGLSFNLSPAMARLHHRTPEALVEESRALLAQAGLPGGTRLALVSPSMDDRMPVPMATFMGNGVLVTGYESAHLYEPLESASAAEAHLGLSTPWRIAVRPERYRAGTEEVERQLARIGVQALISPEAGVLRPPVVRLRDSEGRDLYVRRLPDAPAVSFPWAEAPSGPRPLERLPGGALRTVDATPEPPRVPVPRELRWRRLDDGRWEGVPRVFGPGWVLAEAGMLLATALALWLDRATGRTGGPGQPPQRRTAPAEELSTGAAEDPVA